MFAQLTCYRSSDPNGYPSRIPILTRIRTSVKSFPFKRSKIPAGTDRGHNRPLYVRRTSGERIRTNLHLARKARLDAVLGPGVGRDLHRASWRTFAGDFCVRIGGCTRNACRILAGPSIGASPYLKIDSVSYRPTCRSSYARAAGDRATCCFGTEGKIGWFWIPADTPMNLSDQKPRERRSCEFFLALLHFGG